MVLQLRYIKDNHSEGYRRDSGLRLLELYELKRGGLRGGGWAEGDRPRGVLELHKSEEYLVSGWSRDYRKKLFLWQWSRKDCSLSERKRDLGWSFSQLCLFEVRDDRAREQIGENWTWKFLQHCNWKNSHPEACHRNLGQRLQRLQEFEGGCLRGG